MIERGDTVLCAVSGGADSVALLCCLNDLRDELGITVKAAHYNHMIRGEAADRDEGFVKELCRRLGTECITGSGDVPKYAKECGYTLEQAGRILRYEFLESIKADKIAVAHHMDDQAESVLMHIIRGSGTHGITGMRYVRGRIIRPLLSVRRSEIESYLAERDMSFCTDATNFTEDGTRNKLRLSVIPEITERINPSFTEALCHMADIVRTDDDYLCCIAERELKKSRVGDGYDRQYIADLDEPVRRRVLRMAMAGAGALADIEQKHVEAVEKLLYMRTGTHMDLPHICAFTSYDKICFTNDKGNKKIQDDASLPVTVGENDFCGVRITVSRVSGREISPDAHTAFVDEDKLPHEAVFRRRRAGDRISPVGAGGSKKLKDFFIDKKVERSKRDMPILCAGNEVLCVVGMCVSKYAAVTGSTKNMLKISMEE